MHVSQLTNSDLGSQPVVNDLILPDDLKAELWRLSQVLEMAQDDLTTAAREYAEKEDAYRQAKATSYLTVKALPDNSKATVATLEAMVDKACQPERKAAYIARANKETALERVKSLRAQLSALQSVAASVRSEIEMAGKGAY